MGQVALVKARVYSKPLYYFPLRQGGVRDSRTKERYYLEIVRDEKWEILETSKGKTLQADLSGLRIIEGAKTHLVVPQNRQFATLFCSVQNRKHYFSYYPKAERDRFKPQQVSFILIDNRYLLFGVRAPRFEKTAKEIAEAAISAYRSLPPTDNSAELERRIWVIKKAAKRAYKAHQTGDQARYERTLSLLRKTAEERAIPPMLLQPDRKTTPSTLFSGYAGPFRLHIDRERGRCYFCAYNQQYFLSPRAAASLGINIADPQTAISCLFEKGLLVAVFNPKDDKHQNPLPFRVIRNAQFKIIASVERNIQEGTDLSGIKIVEASRVYSKHPTQRCFSISDEEYEAHLPPDRQITPLTRVSAVIVDNEVCLFSAEGLKFNGASKTIAQAVIKVYESLPPDYIKTKGKEKIAAALREIAEKAARAAEHEAQIALLEKIAQEKCLADELLASTPVGVKAEPREPKPRKPRTSEAKPLTLKARRERAEAILTKTGLPEKGPQLKRGALARVASRVFTLLDVPRGPSDSTLDFLGARKTLVALGSEVLRRGLSPETEGLSESLKKWLTRAAERSSQKLQAAGKG